MPMPFGPFAILSLFYVVIGIRVVYRLIGSWRSVWDRNFTQQDRGLVDESAFFVLVPVSVALHELGHAVAIWSMGGEVVDWGFYGFAGFVSYYPAEFSLVQQTIIAAAGSLVNLLLCLGAFGLVLYRRPPMRASINELLIQFAFLSGANAFIVYPLLDLVSGMNGDWRQMYDSGVPWLTGVIVAIQAGTLLLGYWLATNPAMKARWASLTDVPPGYERGLFGGIKPGKIEFDQLSPDERSLQEAVDRVTSGWAAPVSSHLQRIPNGTAVILEWGSVQQRKAIAVREIGERGTDIVRLPLIKGSQAAPPPILLHRWPTRPSTDALTMGLRVAMEQVDAQ
jgi:hypothetical protein